MHAIWVCYIHRFWWGRIHFHHNRRKISQNSLFAMSLLCSLGAFYLNTSLNMRHSLFVYIYSAMYFTLNKKIYIKKIHMQKRARRLCCDYSYVLLLSSVHLSTFQHTRTFTHSWKRSSGQHSMTKTYTVTNASEKQNLKSSKFAKLFWKIYFCQS